MSDKITAKNVTKVFGDTPRQAVDMIRNGKTKDEVLAETGQTIGVHSVDFTVGEGEVFVVMGLSGSGKSTLVRMLNRLIDATDGEIHIDGEPLHSADRTETLRKLRLEQDRHGLPAFRALPAQECPRECRVRAQDRGVGATSARRARSTRSRRWASPRGPSGAPRRFRAACSSASALPAGLRWTPRSC